MSQDVYLFNLAYWQEGKSRPIVFGEIDGRAKVSKLEIGGQKFVLGEIGESESKDFLLREAYALIEDSLTKYSDRIDSMTVEGGTFRAVKKGLKFNMYLKGERDIRLENEVENAFKKLGNLNQQSDQQIDGAIELQ